MHDGVEAVTLVVGLLLGTGLPKEPRYLGRAVDESSWHAGRHEGLHLTLHQHRLDSLVGPLNTYAFWGVEGHRLVGAGDPRHRVQGDSVLVRQVALGQYRQSGLVAAQGDALADQVGGGLYTAVDVDVHLRLAEEASRENRHRSEFRIPRLGHQVR